MPAPYIVCVKHPSWIQRQHDDGLETNYISDLAAAIRWGFGEATDDAEV